jgi:hypothetical protein
MQVHRKDAKNAKERRGECVSHADLPT